MEGLLSFKADKGINEQIESLIVKITSKYVGWLESDPFDIGYTTRAAMCHWRKVAESTYLDWEEKDVSVEVKK